MNGTEYRKLLEHLGLTKALQTQLHKGFKPEFGYVEGAYEPLYNPNADGRRVRPPPLTEDLSNYGKPTNPRAKWGSRNYWNNLTPAQRKVACAKRRQNALKWLEKRKTHKGIRVGDFIRSYIVINTKKKP